MNNENGSRLFKSINKPLELLFIGFVRSIDNNYTKAFFWVLLINVLAYGFEMSNLTFHHDDVAHIFITTPEYFDYIGRFGLSFFHYYVQDLYLMPFFQMAQGIFFMTVYGLLVSYLWGLRSVLDIIICASILCVFPYVAQIYQYNSANASYPLAHMLVVLALWLSMKNGLYKVIFSAVLYALAFSIYQSVVTCAATVFSIWLVRNLVFNNSIVDQRNTRLLMIAIKVLVTVIFGILIYFVLVKMSNIDFSADKDNYQAINQAFSVERNFDIAGIIGSLIHGTRAFLFWPQNYFPEYLKKIQLVLFFLAVLVCIIRSDRFNKFFALAALGGGLILPRILQIVHPEGNYHELTLTGYAVFIAGCSMIILVGGSVLVRNITLLLLLVLVFGYVSQANWMSTVNQINMRAHFSTMIQILSRLKSLPDSEWDGKTVMVIGKRYDMPSHYPFKPATGIATEFIDTKHMNHLSKLLRENIVFFSANEKSIEVDSSLKGKLPWPNESSVWTMDGKAFLMLSE